MSLLAAIGAFAAGTTAVFTAFKALEETSNPQARRDFSEWLTSPNKQVRTKNRFPQMFRAVVQPYVSRWRVWQLLLLGAAMSFFTLAVAIPLLRFSSGSCYGCPDTIYGLFSDREFWDLLLNFLALGVLPDFVSLVKTKLLVFSSWFVRAPFFVFLMDVMMSALITVTWIALCLYIASRWSLSERPMVYLFPTILTSMMPTVLTLAFLLFAFTTKAFFRVFDLHLSVSEKFLNIKEKPFQSIGLMMAPLVGLVSAVVTALLS